MNLIQKIKWFPYAMKGYLMSNANKNGEFRYLKTLAKDQFVMFDVGANIGGHANKILEYSPEYNVTVHCFEPVKATFNVLKENVKSSNIHNVVFNNFGFSNKKEKLELFVYHEFDKNQKSETDELGQVSGNNSLYNVEGMRPYKVKEKIKIDLITLDEYIINNNIDHIDFLKIDVEGHEFKVLQGATNALDSRTILNIQFEFNDLCKLAGYDIYQICDYLLEKGYKVCRLTP